MSDVGRFFNRRTGETELLPPRHMKSHWLKITSIWFPVYDRFGKYIGFVMPEGGIHPDLLVFQSIESDNRRKTE
jgi:hypothetical protein